MNSKFLVVFMVIVTSVRTAVTLSICYGCNSKEQKLCVKEPSDTMLIRCKDKSDTCGVIINGTDTIRGCSKEIGKGNLIAHPCEEQLCNGQIFPQDRLKCHQCEDCVTLSDETLSPCQHYSASDECYTDVINENKFVRGCISDQSTKITEFAQKCKTPGCNNQTAFETLKCVKCNSEEDINCIKIDDDPACKIATTNECSIKTLLGRQNKPSCFTYIKGGQVERGCTEKESNSDPSENFCSKSDYCNNLCHKPVKCLQCASSDPKCETTNELISQLCKNDIYCSACASNEGNITRSCGFQNKGTCKSCQNEDACNSQKFCYKCSSDTNPNCATWKNLSEIKLEICEDPNEVCVAELINNKIVERGCKHSNQCTLPNCQPCSDKDKCNIAPFPESIRRCIQCSGSRCENEQQKADSVVCDVFDPNDSCYAYADKTGVAHRGCTSNAQDYQKCKDSTNCWTCDTNSCNTPKLLKCYSCSSNITEKCGKWNEPSSIDTITCQNPNQVCATIVRGDKVERGCKFPDALNCEVGDPFCQTCSDKDNCNEGPVNKKPLRCLKCSGKDGCDKEQEKQNAKLCDDSEALCYVYANINGNVFRGCSNEPEFNNCQECWTCNEDGCNYKKLPRCYTCSSGLNENCATAKDINNIQSQFCQNPFDQCISRLVNETIVQRGCQPLAESDPNCKFDSKNCKTCKSKDNCNLDPFPRQQTTCIECSGTGDCKNGKTSESKICSTYESCYIYRNASGNVFRGCFSAPEDYEKCVNDNNSHCWTCKGNECNAEKLQKCYTCESDISGDCSTFKNANEIPSETCHNPEEVCAAVRTGDRVQRGCKLPELLNCNPGDLMCRSCKKDNCNDGSLATYPAKCIKCSGTEDCINVSDPKEASYCEKNVEGEPCYAYADKDGKIFRGCVSNEEEYDKCQNSTNGHCWKCNGDGCNNIRFSHCLSCKSPSDENCAKLDDLNSIPSKVCQIPTQHCISQIVDNIVERGCYPASDLPSSCVFNSPNCKTCDKSDCNTESLPRKPIECIKCLGTEDCHNEQNPTNPNKCITYESCYIFRNAVGKTNRGCISKLEDFTICNQAGNGFCWTCNSTTCNTQKVRSCYTCKSDVNENCATWKNLSEIKLEICKDPNEVCVAELINNKIVERGCKHSNQCTLPNCQPCSDKDKCNIAPFPESIRRCIQCSGSRCENEQQKADSVVCDVFDPNDSCYAYADKTGVAHRGCTSNAQDYQKCKDSTNCWTCDTNSCNTPKLLKCYSCSSNITEKCGKWNEPSSIDTITCQNPNQVCATIVRGDKVERGCKFPDALNCEVGDPFCQTCSDKDNCNEGPVNKKPLRCLKCSGKDGCDKEQEKQNAKLCDDSEALCYVYANINGNVFRGCSNEPEFNNCQECWTCNEDGCNYKKLPRCYSCSSGLNENCATAKDINNIQSQFCQNPFDQCISSLVNETIVQRGCQPLAESDPNCKFDSKNCKTCKSKDNCNLDPFPRQQTTCIECSGTGDCKNGKTSESKICSTYESCYIYRNASGNVFRGCFSAPEDYEKCVNDNNSHCWTCKGNECNAEKLQKCYTCESDISGDCSTFKNANEIPSETCHNPEEVCAAVRTGDRVQRGCKLPELLNCNPGDLMCRSCKKDNCNDGSLATYPAKCIKCSGTEDCVNVSDPKEASYCEKNVEGEPCYAYADKDGKIFRGCVSNEEEYDKCQNSTNGHCWKCNGDGCNNIRFSHCLSCKSPSDENCAKLHDLNSIPSKVCQIPNQNCISQIVDNIVERDCYPASDLPSSCVFNTPNCKTCDKSDCNTESLPRKPIECIKCLGTEDCHNEQNHTNPNNCPTYESCYIFRNAVGKTNRGCISKLEDFTICNQAGNGFCWTCNSTTCNTPKVRSCYTCKSDVSENCATWKNQTSIPSNLCQNPDEICATITLGKTVERRCEKPENVHCEPGDTTCQKCTTDNCNKGIVHAHPKRCHICSGTDDCRLEQLAVNEQSCDGIEDACYVYTNENGQVFRGCMSNKDEYDNCKRAGNGTCWTCTADGCNKDKILECFTCTSVDNENCRIWNVTNGITSKLCKNPEEICTSYIKENQTVRGCNIPDKTCTPLTETCQYCKEDNCNSGTIQKVQLKCYKCSNTDDCQEEQKDKNLSECLTTQTNPSCWAYSDNSGKMIRGCTDDIAGLKKCIDSAICRVCKSDGCNNFPYQSTQSLQCHKCSDSEACGWGQTNDTISPCTNKIAYYLAESCITLKKDNNFERGCTFDLGTCQGNEEMCQKCNTAAGCNNGNIITQSCVQCKSTTETKCAGTAEGIGGKECPAAFSTFNDRGCYTRLTDIKGIVDRGCSQDLSAADLSACKADKDHKFCEYCDSQDCNNKKAPNSAPVSVGLTIGFVVLSSLISIVF